MPGTRLTEYAIGILDPVDHLALAVSDQDRSRRFYETYLGFGAEPSYHASDGTLIIFDGAGFSLALGVVSEPIRLPRFLHFGKRLASPEAVRRMRPRLEHDGVPIVDWWDEPDYVSVKCADPDGYVVELSWEPPAENAASTLDTRSRSTGGSSGIGSGTEGRATDARGAVPDFSP